MVKFGKKYFAPNNVRGAVSSTKLLLVDYSSLNLAVNNILVNIFDIIHKSQGLNCDSIIGIN